MAKKKEKTLEEKLQEALVPENQWPYILPENWCWVKFGSLAKDMADGPFGSNLKTEHYINEKEVRIIQLSNVSENGWKDDNVRYTTFEHAKTISRSIVKPGDIVITKMMPAGRAMICPNLEKEYVLSSDSVKFVPWDCLDRKYMTLGINSTVFRKQVQENTQGITRARTSLKKLKSYIYPLAPLAEQKRIVYRIESLFAKLDEAKEKIQQVLDGAEMRKAAILHKAFTGELTKTWRKENGISEASWVEYTLQSVCTMKITDGTHKTPTYSDKDNGVVFLSAKDITSGEINWENTKYITSELHTELYSRLAPQINDILLAKNGTTGVAALVKEDKVFDIYVTLALLRPNVEIVIPEYLLNIINSPLCKVQFNENLTGIGVPNLHLRDIKDVKIKVPSISEQEIISDKVEMLLANEGMVTKNCLKQIEVIDTMKKSILAKAFRGELGTNNPNEDSALNLLKEVLQDKS
ncbi:MAG: restriction endonuclease subunit S [Veillonellaceae bacterium]|nr:restriction endonuclease subunit S [Veillonellaceae bacterium]